MGIPENIKSLRMKFNLTQQELGEIAGVSGKAVHTWEAGLREPRMGAIQKIADYFNLSKSDLIEDNGLNQGFSRINNQSDNSNFSKKDERDIAKRLEQALSDLENTQDALMFSGEPLDDETRELLKISLENSIRIAKINAKEKFTPKKYKKE